MANYEGPSLFESGLEVSRESGISPAKVLSTDPYDKRWAKVRKRSNEITKEKYPKGTAEPSNAGQKASQQAFKEIFGK